MADVNGSGNGNGPGSKLNDVASNALLILMSRAMSIVGVPVAGFLLWQLTTDIREVRDWVIATKPKIDAMRDVDNELKADIRALKSWRAYNCSAAPQPVSPVPPE